MKRFLLFICILSLTIACQRKKYDPQEYEVGSNFNHYIEEDNLRDQCLTFLYYCDKNRTEDLKVFARDWLRTWKEWETEGVRNIGNTLSCLISPKSRYNHKSVYFSVRKDSIPPVFEGELWLFKTDYEDLVSVVQNEFGDPDDETETQYGTMYNWFISENETIYTFPKSGSVEFGIKYILEQ